MKKRKPPIVLGTCLVLMLVAVGIIYAPKGTKTEEQQAQEAAQQQQADPNTERPTLSTSQASQFVKGQMGNTAPGKPGMPPMGPKGPNMDPNHSAIEAMKPTNFKPKPNDSSTSTQWYTPETQR